MKKSTHSTNATNDNEPLPFVTLGAASRSLVEGCEHHQQRSADDGERSHSEKEKREQHRAYIERGLRQIDLFEKRARGELPWRRRG